MTTPNLSTVLKESWQNNTFPNALIIQTLDITYDLEQIYLFIMDTINSKNVDEVKNNPDIQTIFPEKKSETISIEATRIMKEWYNKTPIFAQNKFCIIAHSETMTINAANSCLKLLEEYNKNSFIILLSENYKSLLETIRSRCRVIYSETKPNFNELEYQNTITAICSKNIDIISSQCIKSFTNTKLAQYITIMFNKIIKHQINPQIKLSSQEKTLFEMLKKNSIQTNIKKLRKVYDLASHISSFDAKHISCILLNEIFT